MKFLIFVISFIASSFAFPKPQTSLREVRSADRNELGNLDQFDPAVAASYLGKYGYISKNRMENVKVGGLIDIRSFSKAIEDFQRMANLKPTGQLNKETIKMMSMSRCGVEDTVGAFMMGSKGNAANSKFQNKEQRSNAKKMNKARNNRRRGRSRSKRYNLEGGRWNKSLLRYHIENYTPDMTKSQIRTAIKNAFNVWANYTTLRFVHTSNPSQADLKISFVRNDHGDGSAFDDKGGVLAHAFFPSDGRAHFDDAETFTFKTGKGVDLFTVAAHEFGHSLGLAHSGVANSLMAPFYQGYDPNFSLHDDDIAAIQQLYGKKMDKDETKKPPIPTTTLRPTVTRKPRMDAMKVCGNQVSFDSMHFDHRAGILYALKGVYYWKINDNGVVPGYPRRISRYWSGLPGNINAAVYSKVTGRTYFFKGRRVWRYDQNRKLERGFPQPVSALGLPANPDAAMQWDRDGKIYVFKNNHFYQFSEYQRYDGLQRYPKLEVDSYWNGVPSNLDAAIQWKNGKTYFFKGDKYWRFSGMGRQMDNNYPKNVKKYWIGCNQNTDPNARLLTSETKSQKRRRHHHKKARNSRRRSP